MGANPRGGEIYDTARDVVEVVESVAPGVTKKAKRKASKYGKQLGIELKRLKRKHPRTGVNKLMKRAHAATRRALK